MNSNDDTWETDYVPRHVPDPLLDPRLLDERLELGSEPFWMQDVRLAQRRLEASRLAARSTDEGQAASGI